MDNNYIKTIDRGDFEQKLKQIVEKIQSGSQVLKVLYQLWTK